MTTTNFDCTSFPSELHEDEEHHRHFYFKSQASSSSSSSSLPNSILFNSNQEQGGTCSHRESQHIQDQTEESTTSGVKLCIDWKNGDDGNGNPSESSGSVKWMSSKMRLMKKKMMMSSAKMMVTDQSTLSSKTQKLQSATPKIKNYKAGVNNLINPNPTITIRVCADCNTTKTPLWRTGPRGPKSLCNACGIRQRKARRAMAAAANEAVESPTTTRGVKNSDRKVMKHKNKRSSDETFYTLPIKKRYKLQTQPHRRGRKKRICFEDLPRILSKNSTAYQQVFPQDEREAAILLMALSYGLVCG